MRTAGADLDLRDYIRDVPGFPKPGIIFKDITPLLADGEAFCTSIRRLATYLPQDIDAIVGIEARGFIFGAGLAQYSRVGLVPVRKPGKLPAEVHGIDYDLEYGVDRLEIHRDSLSSGHRVVIVDDLLASGGTVSATIDLVRKLGAEVAACLFIIELKALEGRKRIANVPVHSLIVYD
jgi:adenine phosphoribosyltransferase